MQKELIIYCDGGSRGNPGPAASAFIVFSDGEIIHQQSKYLGITTNNFAEYSAVLLALSWTGTNLSITFYLDSELVTKQINGDYKIKNDKLKNLHTDILEIIKTKKLITKFINIPREKNKIADRAVNKELDKKIS